MSYQVQQVQKLINKYFKPESLAFKYYSIHSEKVTQKAIEISKINSDKPLNLDVIYQSAMLHDIGICRVYAPEIGCFGEHPYLAHGYLGRKILEQEGFNSIAPICERHVGMGISREEIARFKLNLPDREMIPISDEEKLVCLADKFYSKSPEYLEVEKSIDIIRKGLGRYGQSKIDKFEELLLYFKIVIN